jgi:hypothetical protein
MKKTYLIFTLLIGICFTTLGQNLNSYKYIVVPEKFDFLKESNQYQMNELTKFLFEKYGFKAYLVSEEKPLDWAEESCNTLYTDIKEDGGLFVTTLQVILKDCRNQIIFTSEEGTSREKDYKKAYQEALREAFNSINAVDYNYEKNIEEADRRSSVKPDEKKAEPKKVITPISKVPEVVISAIPRETEKVAVVFESKPNKKTFVSGDMDYYLLNTDFGFQLYQNEMQEPFAKLIKTQSPNNFIYSTIQNQGIAFFDRNGNLIVEIINDKENSTSIKIYGAKD